MLPVSKSPVSVKSVVLVYRMRAPVTVWDEYGRAGEERQQMAGRCLGELVRKMGERVLTHIIPILQKGMSSDDAATRQASASTKSTNCSHKESGDQDFTMMNFLGYDHLQP